MNTFMRKSNTRTGTDMKNTISIRTGRIFPLASPTATDIAMLPWRTNTPTFPTFIIGMATNVGMPDFFRIGIIYRSCGLTISHGDAGESAQLATHRIEFGGHNAGWRTGGDQRSICPPSLRRGPGGAIALGVPFSVAICPFCTPALIVLLGVAASIGSPLFGTTLLLAFALGRNNHSRRGRHELLGKPVGVEAVPESF